MDDADIMAQIQRLVDEEHQLLEAAARDELQGDAHRRLESVETSLDQCWDLLRQRRARRHAGADPGTAEVRDTDTVEHYLQ